MIFQIQKIYYNSKSRYFESGLGYYSKVSDLSRFNIHIGFGRGKSKTTSDVGFSDEYYLTEEGTYNKYFIQPMLGLSYYNFEIGGSFRFSYVDFFYFKSNGEVSKNHKSNFFLEPSTFLNYSWLNFKIQFQLGVSFHRGTNQFDYSGVYAGLGLIFFFNIL